jgi:hypothetical protein
LPSSSSSSSSPRPATPNNNNDQQHITNYGFNVFIPTLRGIRAALGKTISDIGIPFVNAIYKVLLNKVCFNNQRKILKTTLTKKVNEHERLPHLDRLDSTDEVEEVYLVSAALSTQAIQQYQ